MRTVEQKSLIWLRVLDVEACLTARPWYADGSVVLEVTDPLGIAGGTWRLGVEAGRASLGPTDEDADRTLGVDVLANLYLGDSRVPTLAAAGRLSASPAARDTFAAMADGGPAPYCTTGF